MRRSHRRFGIPLVVAALMVVNACGGDDAVTSPVVSTVDTAGGDTTEPAPTESTIDGSVGAAPVRTSPPASGPLDSFTWATSFEAVSLDPLYSWNYPENTILPNMCESVVQLSTDLELRPGLASDIDLSDPLKVVLTVRQDVTFWNGNPMTAEDVAFSLGRNLDPALGSYFGSFWTRVADVAVSGDDEVTITLTEPDTLFWQTLSMAAGVVSEQASVEAAAGAYGTPDGGLMCTGPYQLTSWKPGGDLVMNAYDGYWNADLTPMSAQVVFRSVPDDAALINALRTGEIDGSFQTPVSGVATLTAAGAGVFYPGESTMTHMLIPSLDGPLGDVRLRKALSLAIDRTIISEIAWEGQAQPVYSVASPSTWGYATADFEEAYGALGIGATADLEAAKALVAEVGPVETMTIWAPTENPSIVTTANYIAGVAQDIGLDIVVETVPIQTYSNWLYDPASREATDLFQTIWWTDVPDPLQALWPLIQPGGGFNFYGYDNPAPIADLTAAFAAVDDDERAALVISAQQAMFGDDMLWIPVANVATPTFLGSRITGPPVGLPAYLYIPWAAYVGAA
jgi:peptide/nickel transport system substrate-binding protein